MSLAKRFKLSADQIAPVIEGQGWCLATNRIMVDGARIGYMYRETPHGTGDSGWRFFAGDEDEEYMGIDENHGVYDLNTVANYDPAVLPYLALPVGSALHRAGERLFANVANEEDV